MRGWLLFLPITALASPALAQSISLDPFKTSLGFAPQRPRAVDSRHPLFGRILVEDVEEMPDRVGAFLMSVTSRREFNTTVRTALASANFLAETPEQARVRLRITWRRFDLPFRIGFSSRATAALRYDLTRIDTGQVIFSREIETGAEFRGGNAYLRARGTGRRLRRRRRS